MLLLPDVITVEAEAPMTLSLPPIDTSVLTRITEQFFADLYYRPPANASLTPEQVRFIRHSDKTVDEKAEQFGVSSKTIKNVISGRTYKGVY